MHRVVYTHCNNLYVWNHLSERVMKGHKRVLDYVSQKAFGDGACYDIVSWHSLEQGILHLTLQELYYSWDYRISLDEVENPRVRVETVRGHMALNQRYKPNPVIDETRITWMYVQPVISLGNKRRVQPFFRKKEAVGRFPSEQPQGW